MTDKKNTSEVKLRRVLSLSDLIIYGIILIQPVAALPLFGHANNISKGHAATTILIAMVAMIFTAISYGRMANRYPSSGSAYTYVSKGYIRILGLLQVGQCLWIICLSRFFVSFLQALLLTISCLSFPIIFG